MATINANNDMTHHFTFTAPYGNNTVRYHRLSTAGTTGIIDQGLDKKAIGAGDVVILGDLPCGFVLTDAIVSVVTGFTGAASLGFKYKDGKDSEVSIHAPVWGANDFDMSTDDGVSVSIHAPVWGANPCLCVRL